MSHERSIDSEICELLAKCLQGVLDVFKESPLGEEIRITTKEGIQREVSDIHTALDSVSKTQSFRSLVTLVTTHLESNAVGPGQYDALDLVTTAILYSLNRVNPREWNESAFTQCCQELERVCTVPTFASKVMAPLYWASQEPLIQAIDQTTYIRKANTSDRALVQNHPLASEDTVESYGSVLECILETEPSIGEFHEWRAEAVSVAENLERIAACLRVFSSGIPHLRVMVSRGIVRGTFDFEHGTPEEFAFKICGKRPLGSPGLVVGKAAELTTLTHEQLQDLPTFYSRFLEALQTGFFSRAVRRFERAIISDHDEDIFTDLVLALESLLQSSMADVQYRVASLVCSDGQERNEVHKFMKIVYSQRNPVLHGGKAFGQKFQKQLRMRYSSDTNTEWFIEQFTSLVRTCMRLAVLSDKLLRGRWASELTENLLNHVDNSNIVSGIPHWMVRNRPVFLFRSTK